MGPLEHSVPDLALLRNVNTFPQRTTPDPLEHSGLPGEEDGGRRLVPLEPLEHSVLGASQDQRDVSSSDGDLRVDSMSAGFRESSRMIEGLYCALGWPSGGRTNSARGWACHCCGAVGSAVPWFLTGWAHEVEVDRQKLPSDDFGYDDIRTYVYSGSHGALQIVAMST